jgi:hypothetical protein
MSVLGCTRATSYRVSFEIRMPFAWKSCSVAGAMARRTSVLALTLASALLGVSSVQAAKSPPIDPAIAVYVEQIPTATGSQVAGPLQRSTAPVRPSVELVAKAGSDAPALAALGASSRPRAGARGTGQRPSGTPIPRVGLPVAGSSGGDPTRLVLVLLIAGLGTLAALVFRLRPGRRAPPRVS